MIEIAQLFHVWPGQDEADALTIGAWQVAAGEQVFLHGESGAGKSTLLALLAGVLTAQQGRVVVLGQDWRALAPAARDAFRADHVGYVFQQFNLLPYLGVVDNVLLPLRFSARRAQAAGLDAAAHCATALALLERMGLPAALATRPVAQLSVGQQQRVAAARALIGQPELVLADEPTSALDAPRREGFLALLQAQCRAAGATLVFVSHDERLAARFDRSVALADLTGTRTAATPAPA